jgi:hypothetical protein
MICYINPPHGNDATGIVAETQEDALQRPFKTHQAAIEAFNASREKMPNEPHILRETHNPIHPQISQIQS